MADGQAAVSRQGRTEVPARADVVIVGAGFAGMYLIKLLREQGQGRRGAGGRVRRRRDLVLEPLSGRAVRYRVDAVFATSSTRNWSRSGPGPSVTRRSPRSCAYAEHVADRHDIWRDVCFDTFVTSAAGTKTAASGRWRPRAAIRIGAPYCILATGLPLGPEQDAVSGRGRASKGPVYRTGLWPHEEVRLRRDAGRRDRRTGSSAIQSIPIIAAQAAEMWVFQRTPNYSIAGLQPAAGGRRGRARSRPTMTGFRARQRVDLSPRPISTRGPTR